jgi:5-methylcytosine-specific restriction endonuclease McrA
MPTRTDKAWLLKTAKAVAAELKKKSQGTRLRIRTPYRTVVTNTDGWQCIIGDLGKGQSRLEIWLDRFPAHAERKLYACFYSWRNNSVSKLSKRVSKNLWPIREISIKDIKEAGDFVLAQPLRRGEFNAPILERYPDGSTFFGVYDLTRPTLGVNEQFCDRAVAFFEDVARALPLATAGDESTETYPQYENRRHVVSHLHRERSRLLATECKARDNYQCQVCGLRFDERYGKIGKGFAEAHHRVPLSQLRENVRTRIEDLATVCANCHRMLHRMAGKRDDVKKLKTVVRSHKRKHR